MFVQPKKSDWQKQRRPWKVFMIRATTRNTFWTSLIIFNYDQKFIHLGRLSNCDINFFTFQFCFWLMSPKFMNFERVPKELKTNVKLWNGNHEITKVNKIGANIYLKLFNTMEFYLILLNDVKDQNILLNSVEYHLIWLNCLQNSTKNILSVDGWH